MAGFIKQVFSSLRSKSDKNDCKIVLSGDSSFENNSALHCTAEYHTGDFIKKHNKMTREARMTIINRGEVRITERIVVVEMSALPRYQEKQDEALARGALQRSSEKDFVVQNSGRLNVVFNLYLFVDDAKALIQSGSLQHLEGGIGWESPAIVKENTGKITKNVEIVAKLGDEDIKSLDNEYAVGAPPYTDLENKIFWKHNFTPMDMDCFKQALCSIAP